MPLTDGVASWNLKVLIFDCRSHFQIILEREVKPFCTLCLSFKSIALVSREESERKVRWKSGINKKLEERRKNRHNADAMIL